MRHRKAPPCSAWEEFNNLKRLLSSTLNQVFTAKVCSPSNRSSTFSQGNPSNRPSTLSQVNPSSSTTSNPSSSTLLPTKSKSATPNDF